ncbi:MAG: thiamine biosynthesis protein ThiS [Candidatus Rokuibacteriota bacterium]|nr:MAG: thiamine biosynthesis protein ThiS [Candidatus Rokubacteria bacterium]
MQITVNGKAMDVAEGLSIDALLVTLGVKREFTAVAVNREIARRAEFESFRLKDGDRVEVVRPMGGGSR